MSIVNLNTKEINGVVVSIMHQIMWAKYGWDYVDDFTKAPKIKARFNMKENMLYINGKAFFRYDRHHHYPSMRDHMYATYVYLQAVETVSENILDKHLAACGV